jgi:hypothetical protein
VVDSEPPSEPELDPELPPPAESWPEPSLLPPPPSGLSVDGWVTAVASSEPSWPLPDERLLSCDPDPPEPDSREPSRRRCERSGSVRRTSRPGRTSFRATEAATEVEA